MSFKSPPLSKSDLDQLISKVLIPSFSGRHVTVAYFRGAGKPFELKYLLKNLDSIPKVSANQFYIWLDMKTLQSNSGDGFKVSFNDFSMRYESKLSPEAKEDLHKILAGERVTLGEYTQFIKQHFLDKGLFVTFVFEHFGLTYIKDLPGKGLRTLANTLRELSLTNVSCIFLTGVEFDQKSLTILGSLQDSFTANIVWGNYLPYSASSTRQTFANHQELHNVTFSKSFVDLVADIACGDPTSTRRLMLLAASDKEFEKRFLSTKGKIEDIVPLIDANWYDTRFIEIITSLLPSTVKKLSDSDLNDLPEFVLKCGMFQPGEKQAEQKPKFINPMFKHFMVQVLPKLLETDNLSSFYRSENEKSTKEYLSGQEYIVLKYLEENEGDIVSKDSIAKTIWGNDWEEKYSDWAIDKLVSNIRKKLSENKYPGTITTFKGKGIMLS